MYPWKKWKFWKNMEDLYSCTPILDILWNIAMRRLPVKGEYGCINK